MQTDDLQTLYHHFLGALAVLPDPTASLCLYKSQDRVYFHAYPQPGFGFHTSTFQNILPELRTHFAVQATGAFIRAAIDSTTIHMLHEIDIGYGYSVRVFDDAAQLASAASHHQSYAFVRADACLVVWSDNVNTAMAFWNEIMFCLQSQFGGAVLPSNPMPSLSANIYGDSLGMDQLLQLNPFDTHAPQQGSSSQPLVDALSDFSFLATPTTPSPSLDAATQYTNPVWFWNQTDSPVMGGLQHGLQMLNTSSESSLENAVPSYNNFGDMPLTVNLASISPPPVGVYDLSQEEDPIISSSSSSCGLSLDFASDVAISPSSGSFAQSPSSAQQNTSAEAPSFRRHSVGPASAPERTVGQKTKRDGGDTSENNEDEHHYDYNYNIDDESYFTPSQASADQATKRRRAAGLEEAIVKATSAPARFTVPLPNIEHAHLENDDDDGRSSISVSSSQSFTLVSTPGSTTGSLVQVPSPLPSPLSPAPAPAQRRVRRRAGTRARRTKCEYCPKTFSRMQDAERHARSSCPDNPKKAGVPCPECGEILSRQDSAQRHWRGHENPQREPPDWASMRA